MGSWGLGKALQPALNDVVEICMGHYIWCLASAQATTGSVPGCFVSFSVLHPMRGVASTFHLLKKRLGRPDLMGFVDALSSHIWLVKHFAAARLDGMRMSGICRLDLLVSNGLEGSVCRSKLFFGASPNSTIKGRLEVESPAVFEGVAIQSLAQGRVSGQGQCAHALRHGQWGSVV